MRRTQCATAWGYQNWTSDQNYSNARLLAASKNAKILVRTIAFTPHFGVISSSKAAEAWTPLSAGMAFRRSLTPKRWHS
jgi:hypothetical protein